MTELASFIALVLSSATPLLLAGLGLLINERAGVLNLGAEGMMLVGAFAGFVVALTTLSPLLGFIAAGIAGAFLAGLFAILALGIVTNQVAAGLALTLFGSGLTAFLGSAYVGASIGISRTGIPLLKDIPFLGEAFFSLHWMSYIALIFTFVLAWVIKNTRIGLELRAIGESPESAHALGYKVRQFRLCAVLLGGAFCGLAGAFLSIAYTPMWVEGMVAGKGWIALALTTFATWRAGRLLLGALLFGGVNIAQLHLQAFGVDIPSQILSMLPYLATIIVLVLILRRPDWIKINMPASLGRPYRPH